MNVSLSTFPLQRQRNITSGDITNLVSPVIHLDVVPVHVYVLLGIVEHRRGSRIPRVARHVVGDHEDDLAVGDAQALHAAVYRQHVRDVTVIEPETRRVHQHRPVVRVPLAAALKLRRDLDT